MVRNDLAGAKKAAIKELSNSNAFLLIAVGDMETKRFLVMTKNDHVIAVLQNIKAVNDSILTPTPSASSGS